MKKIYLLSFLIVIVLQHVRAQYVHIASGQQFYIGNEVTMRGDVVNGAAVTITSGQLHFSGNEYKNLASASYAGSGYVTFGIPVSGSQQLEGGNVFFQKARIDNINNLQLKAGSDVGITDTLDFANGSIELGNQNLNMAGDAGFSRYASNKRVVTNGTGYVSYNTVAAGKSLFYPLACHKAADYSPAEIKNGTTAQTIYLSVIPVPGTSPQPNAATGIRRIWNLWSDAGGALDTLILYHSDSLNGSQYTSAQSAVTRYVSNKWQLPCSLDAELTVGSLKVIGANDNILANTSLSATGDAYYSKVSELDVPSITLSNAHPAVCLGTGIASLTYSVPVGGADKYSISWNTAAAGAGFANTANAALSGNIDITVPTGAAAGLYIGTLSVRSSSTGCVSTDYTISVTVHPLPQPVVNWNGTQLSTGSNYASYQWYRGTQQITGATAATYVPAANGSYAVSVTDSNGCTSLSSYQQATVGIDQLNMQHVSVRVYPNPSNAILNIEASIPVSAQLSAMDGRMVLKEINGSQLNIASLPSGVYLLHIRDTNGTIIKTERVSKY